MKKLFKILGRLIGLMIPMDQFTDIMISGGNYLSTAVAVSENQIGVQVNWHGLDGEVTIIPLQSIDNSNFVGFMDEDQVGVEWKIGDAPSTRALGSKLEVLNGVRCKYLKIRVLVGEATTGEIDLIETY